MSSALKVIFSDAYLNAYNNLGMAKLIFIKFVIDIMPFNADQKYYFYPTFYKRKAGLSNHQSVCLCPPLTTFDG
jgi:hypothetical protein